MFALRPLIQEMFSSIELLTEDDVNEDFGNSDTEDPCDDVIWKEEELFGAVLDGNLNRIREIVKFKGLSFKPEWLDGYTLLCFAVHRGQIQAAKLLLHLGAKVNCSEEKVDDIDVSRFNFDPFKSPLHYAVDFPIENDGKYNVKRRKTPNVLNLINLLLEKYNAEVNAVDINSKTALFNAVKRADAENIKLLIQHGATVNFHSDPFGETPLYMAIHLEYNDIADLLQSFGASFNSTSKYGTLLHVAAKKNDSRLLKFLINKGLDVDATNDVGNTPLHLARLECTKLLVKHGADVNKQDQKGNTPAHYVMMYGQSENSIKALTTGGAFLNIRNQNDETVLHCAIKCTRSSAILKHLLENGADVHETSNGLTVLELAVLRGCDLQVVEICLEETENLSDRLLGSLIHYAAKHRCDQVTKLLLGSFKSCLADINNSKYLVQATVAGLTLLVEHQIKLGADVNTTGKVEFAEGTGNFSLLQIAVRQLHDKMQERYREMAEMLLNNGADINVRDSSGRSLLHFLLMKNDVEEDQDIDRSHDKRLLSFLLKEGINCKAEGDDGSTIFHAAAEVGNKYLIEEIGKFGLSINLDCITKQTKMTPLHLAVREGWTSTVKSLLDLNSNIQAKMSGGSTPLHIAIMKQRPKIASLLLRFGADVEAEDDYGRTALHIATWMGSHHFVEKLLMHHADIDFVDNYDQEPYDVSCGPVECYDEIDEKLNELLNSYKTIISYNDDHARSTRDTLDEFYFTNEHKSHGRTATPCTRYCYYLKYASLEVSDTLKGYMKFCQERKELLKLPTTEMTEWAQGNIPRIVLLTQVVNMDMKNESLHLSYYSIVTAPVQQLALKMRKCHENLNIGLKNGFDQFLGPIKRSIQEARDHEQVIKSGRVALCKAMSFPCPVLILNEIVQYLDHHSIKKLIKATAHCKK